MLIAGVDEVGRGPLAGPVCAAAVILSGLHAIPGITDSKKLTPSRRATLDAAIREGALAWSLGWASVQEIDRLNILQASLLAMQRAVNALEVIPGRVLVDGCQCPTLPMTVRAVVRGDALVPEIGAASILAKVARDRLMDELECEYPGYGLARHKGYPTRVHLEALARLGPTPQHRLSFGPVRKVLDSFARG